MTMLLVTSPTLTPIIALRDAIDALLGYPKAGVDVGGGIHAPAAQSMTLHDEVHIVHPANGTFALPIRTAAAATRVTNLIAACAARVTAGTAGPGQTLIAGLPAPVPYDSTWDPPAVVLT